MSHNPFGVWLSCFEVWFSSQNHHWWCHYDPGLVSFDVPQHLIADMHFHEVIECYACTCYCVGVIKCHYWKSGEVFNYKEVLTIIIKSCCNHQSCGFELNQKWFASSIPMGQKSVIDTHRMLLIQVSTYSQYPETCVAAECDKWKSSAARITALTLCRICSCFHRHQPVQTLSSLIGVDVMGRIDSNCPSLRCKTMQEQHRCEHCLDFFEDVWHF